MSTYFPKQGEIARKWYVVDAAGQTLGRLATRVASMLATRVARRPSVCPAASTTYHLRAISPCLGK